MYRVLRSYHLTLPLMQLDDSDTNLERGVMSTINIYWPTYSDNSKYVHLVLEVLLGLFGKNLGS